MSTEKERELWIRRKRLQFLRLYGGRLHPTLYTIRIPGDPKRRQRRSHRIHRVPVVLYSPIPRQFLALEVCRERGRTHLEDIEMPICARATQYHLVRVESDTRHRHDLLVQESNYNARLTSVKYRRSGRGVRTAIPELGNGFRVLSVHVPHFHDIVRRAPIPPFIISTARQSERRSAYVAKMGACSWTAIWVIPP